MGTDQNFVCMPWLGPEVPLGEPEIGKRVNAQEKQASGPQNPEDFADYLRRIVHMIEDIETDREARAAILKWQSLPRGTDKMQSVSTRLNFSQ
ncbi:MAG TPA: hypothetical protein VNY24_19715 [Candidatus Acidoferrales bacterium]|nr:hypothetical protein [Candidatus Acidoferrales bacterium]